MCHKPHRKKLKKSEKAEIKRQISSKKNRFPKLEGLRVMSYNPLPQYI